MRAIITYGLLLLDQLLLQLIAVVLDLLQQRAGQMLAVNVHRAVALDQLERDRRIRELQVGGD